MLQIPTKAVEPPAENEINSPGLCRQNQLVECWTKLGTPRDTGIHKLHGCLPSSNLAVPPQFEKLIGAGLFVGGNSCVKGYSHEETLVRKGRKYKRFRSVCRL